MRQLKEKENDFFGSLIKALPVPKAASYTGLIGFKTGSITNYDTS